MAVSVIIREERPVLRRKFIFLLFMDLTLRKKFQTKSLQGFSLGEVLLAGFVLTVGLLAMTALITKSLQNSFETRDTIVAVLLAQEGVELVRNVRDNDFADAGDGFDASDGFHVSGDYKHCRINFDENPLKVDCVSGNGNAPSNKPDRYYLGYVSGMYKHTGNKGKFSRYIYIDYDNSAKEAIVKSFVYWGNVPNEIEEGETANCNVVNKCVYTEAFLNSWYAAP